MGDINPVILNGIQYALTGVAGTITLGRFYIRWQYSKLAWDDLFNGLALACLITQTSLPNAIDLDTPLEWQLNLALQMLLWTTLWCVKASFLALCWMIFKVSAAFRKAWWVVTVYTALSYWPITLSYLWECGEPSDYDNPAACISYYYAPSNTNQFLAFAIAEAALHVSTELSILALSLTFIRRLQMSKIQKISAAAIFCVAIVTVITGILRTMAYVSVDLNFNVEASFNISNSMECIEPSLAVIVCALPAYKALLSKFQKRKKEALEQRQNAINATAAPPPQKSEPKRNIVGQDSITELEMA